MRKPIKYSIWIISIILILFLSVDIKKLDKLQEDVNIQFDLKRYVDNFWDNGLPASIEKAPGITLLIDLLKDDPNKAFDDYSKVLGISQTHYFITKGEGVIRSVDEEDITVRIDNSTEVKIATGFIFGNAVRDGSGKVNIDDFLNMTDFNNVSVAINKMVKENVVSVLKRDAAPGMKLEFAGAFEINEENLSIEDIRVIPFSASLKH